MDETGLAIKFELDVLEKSRIMRLLLIMDQMLNVIVWNGSHDETVSGHIGRKIEAGMDNWFDRLVCKGLRVLQAKHCMRSIGE